MGLPNVRTTSEPDQWRGSAVGQSSKSLRDSVVRGAGEFIKLNLSTEQATSARSLTWMESNAT